jgi:hypothetical protein
MHTNYLLNISRTGRDIKKLWASYCTIPGVLLNKTIAKIATE